jgi:Zn-dependent protease/predicted transcriptional regulator
MVKHGRAPCDAHGKNFIRGGHASCLAKPRSDCWAALGEEAAWVAGNQCFDSRSLRSQTRAKCPWHGGALRKIGRSLKRLALRLLLLFIMFRSSYRLRFKLAGIPLYLHISFLFILPLMAWAAAKNITFLVHQPQFGLDLDPAAFGGWVPLVLGFIAVIGLFVSVVLHELGHSLVARRYGVKVRRITLWFLGGVAEFEEMPRQRGAEAVVGIAGPIVSFVLAGIFTGLAAVVIPRTLPTVWVVVYYLAAINFMLGLFNLLPALPMDGGRILRSLLALKMPHAKATLIAGNVAKVMAVGMALVGLLTYHWMLILLALFIFTAVKSETQQSVVIDLLKGIRVGDLMTRNVTSVPAGLAVGQLSGFMMANHHSSFPVVDEQGRLIGTVGVEQMQNVHPQTPVWQVMSTQIESVGEKAEALEAFMQMGRSGLERLIVLDEAGRIIGIISQTDLMRAIQVRMVNLQAGQKPAEVYVRQGPFGHYPPSARVP